MFCAFRWLQKELLKTIHQLLTPEHVYWDTETPRGHAFLLFFAIFCILILVCRTVTKEHRKLLEIHHEIWSHLLYTTPSGQHASRRSKRGNKFLIKGSHAARMPLSFSITRDQGLRVEGLIIISPPQWKVSYRSPTQYEAAVLPKAPSMWTPVLAFPLHTIKSVFSPLTRNESYFQNSCLAPFVI